MLASFDDLRFIGFVSCPTSNVKSLLVSTSQNNFDALNHVTIVIFSKILVDHRFPRNVLLTYVDDVSPKLDLFSYCAEFLFYHDDNSIGGIIVVLISCLNLEKYSPCAQIPTKYDLAMAWSFL